ncbi:hypothetical protein JYK18_14195 [Amycolatopsis sp. 195334CR]|nr:hypothetical protein [Amycolatopsis sp. 195334CR]
MSSGDDNAEVRRKLVQWMQNLAELLPVDSAQMIRGAFGIQGTSSPFYQDRVRQLAISMDRDDRTVRRRIDDAIEQMAQLAHSSVGSNSSQLKDRSWHTEELRVALILDLDTPEVFETRRIIIDADELAEVDFALTADVSRSTKAESPKLPVEIDMIYGGTLYFRVMESSDRARMMLRLPMPLRRGALHEFGLRMRVPGPPEELHYVCVPRKQCDFFDLRVRFGKECPESVDLIESAFQGDIRDPYVKNEKIIPDGAGEVHVQFRSLTPGFAYGIRWSESSSGLQAH